MGAISIKIKIFELTARGGKRDKKTSIKPPKLIAENTLIFRTSRWQITDSLNENMFNYQNIK